jgi:tannase/feruloyl esterase
MRTGALALMLSIVALFGSASVVRAADATCVDVLSGIIDGNVVVPQGTSCTMSDVTIRGNVQVSDNASLTIDATQQPATIGGNIEADRCVFVLLKGGVTVDGNIQIRRCLLQSGFVGPGIKIGGNFECHKNLGACEATLGDVRGNVRILSNRSTAPSDISLVAVGGDLQCHQNTPAPTHAFGPDWVSGNLQSQCAGFAPTTAAPTCTTSTFNVPNLTVASAVDVPATNTTPEYCQVIGAVATIGEGYDPGSAQFRLKLPVQWNNHFLFEGCGGNCGSITATSVNAVDNAESLGLGYAVVNTDTGHEQDPTTPDPTWILLAPGVPNMPAIIDFYYREVHQVTVATKQYVQAYYSQPIDYAYFDGCSTGGRQSVMEGKRYPVDYDGLIVGDPAISLAYARTSGYKLYKAFLSPLAWIPFSTVAQVDAAVKASCDALDGVIDGLIQNPARCSFNPSSLVPSILTATQAAGLRSYITKNTDPNGAPVYPGMPISDLSTSGFEGINDYSTAATDPTAAEPWGAAGVGPVAWTLTADPGIRYYVEHDASFDVNNDWPQLGNVVPDSTLALLRERQGAGNSDDPFQLKNFLGKGGKVILYHGGSDPLITPFRSVWYYEELASLYGGYSRLQDNVRFFMVPGMGHCSGGVSPNSFDTLQALDNWVTKDVAPDGIIATATNGRTMPLCKFPEEASYSGSGDVNLAANWSCHPNDTRMLRVGTNGVAAGATRATALQYLYDENIGLGGK